MRGVLLQRYHTSTHGREGGTSSAYYTAIFVTAWNTACAAQTETL